MAYASRAGHCVTNAESPSAQGQCDKCGAWWPLTQLSFQYDWRGNVLQNLHLRVCPTCYDTPWEFYRPIVTPPDPIPVPNPRPAQTNTGAVGWGMGGWSTGRWNIGQSPTQPTTVTEFNNPNPFLDIDE